MSVFLINCSNLKQGGGLQVADSVCGQLYRYPQHRFHVVLSEQMKATRERIKDYKNVEVYEYGIKNNPPTIICGCDRFLDERSNGVQAVLTIFGPSRWNPRCKHLSGFAMSHLVIPESPFFTEMSKTERLKWRLRSRVLTYFFHRSADAFWTENPYISDMLPRLLGNNVKVHTVSNYYNQVFDMPEIWRKHPLSEFEGTTCLSVSSYYPHKNFGILVETTSVLEREHPEFNFRFVLTFEEGLMAVPDELKQHFVFIGKVDVSECPDLYRQADIMVMPTLLECFTATYPEAMRMEVPIVTTDLEFARGLCGEAACYYSAVDAEACAEAIYRVATDKAYRSLLTANGKAQLKKYDNYEQRADKLIGILEGMVRG